MKSLKEIVLEQLELRVLSENYRPPFMERDHKAEQVASTTDDVSTQAGLANHPHWMVRKNLAENPKLDPNVATSLAADSESLVAVSLADRHDFENLDKSSSGVLSAKLRQHPDKAVKMKLEGSSPEDIQKHYGVPDSWNEPLRQ